MPNFAQKVEHAVDALSGTNDRQVNEGDFIGASQMVIDHVREIRKAVLTNRVRVEAITRDTGAVLITIKSYLPGYPRHRENRENGKNTGNLEILPKHREKTGNLVCSSCKFPDPKSKKYFGICQENFHFFRGSG